MQSLLILGRQPALGLAELESLYGADKIQSVGDRAAVVDVDPCLLAFDRLGGSVKFCKMLTILETTAWKQIEKFLLEVSPGHSQRMPEGKMQLGLSVIGVEVSLGQLEATGLTLKKVIRKTGRSVRLVPNKELELNSASVLHNNLTGPTGWELVFIRDGARTIVAQTVKVQDIESYTRRDRERPKRDTKVGMLPPKLAQIIINLAVGKLPEDKLESICDIPAGEPIPHKLLDKTVLDPFCGTGVILQEALLMGYEAYGTDLDQRMVDYSRANLAWLADKFGFEAEYGLAQGDATNFAWQQSIDFIASEAYLGRPFTSQPDDEILAQTVSECNIIIKKFLQNMHTQLASGTRLCLAVPAWQVRNGERGTGNGEGRRSSFPVHRSSFRHLPLIDQISEMGYNRVELEHVQSQDLLYYRSDQIVARELLIITRK